MAKQIFINLSVKNLDRTKEFFTALGFSFNPQFTDDNAACLIIGENIFAMLLTEKFFKGFTKKEIADTSKVAETIICIDADSRQQVDDMVSKALAAGGKAPNPPADHGWMYGHGFEDVDGHLWEIAYMDYNAIPKQ